MTSKYYKSQRKKNRKKNNQNRNSRKIKENHRNDSMTLKSEHTMEKNAK